MLKLRSWHWLMASALVVSLASTTGCGRVRIGVKPLPSPSPSPTPHSDHDGRRDHPRPPVGERPDDPSKPGHRPHPETGNGSTQRPGHSAIRFGDVRVFLTRAVRLRLASVEQLSSVARVRLTLTPAAEEEPRIHEVGPEILATETPSVTFSRVRTGHATLLGEAFDGEGQLLGSREVPVSVRSGTTSEIEVSILTDAPEQPGTVTADIALEAQIPQ